jgi:hypothetical protein
MRDQSKWKKDYFRKGKDVLCFNLQSNWHLHTT